MHGSEIHCALWLTEQGETFGCIVVQDALKVYFSLGFALTKQRFGIGNFDVLCNFEMINISGIGNFDIYSFQSLLQQFTEVLNI